MNAKQFGALAVGQRFTYNRMKWVKASKVRAIALPSLSTVGITRKFSESARVWPEVINKGM